MQFWHRQASFARSPTLNRQIQILALLLQQLCRADCRESKQVLTEEGVTDARWAACDCGMRKISPKYPWCLTHAEIRPFLGLAKPVCQETVGPSVPGACQNPNGFRHAGWPKTRLHLTQKSGLSDRGALSMRAENFTSGGGVELRAREESKTNAPRHLREARAFFRVHAV